MPSVSLWSPEVLAEIIKCVAIGPANTTDLNPFKIKSSLFSVAEVLTSNKTKRLCG